jgi:hypothetical protein
MPTSTVEELRPVVAERATMTKILLQNETLAPNAEKRLLPGLDVRRWDRLHFHVGADARSVAGLKVRILFGTSMPGTHCGALLADSTVWFEETVSEREFVHTAPLGYTGTGFCMSVPVVAPLLYDVILTNTGNQPLTTLYVTLMAQEI